VAIRIQAEKFLHDSLLSNGKTDEEIACQKNQLGNWTRLYKELMPNDENRNIIERVNMMTPEMLHLNSFMYEPLIDLSVSHLIKLYVQCKNSLAK